MSKPANINDIFLEAHRRSFLKAEETAIRTGTALIVYKKGKLVAIKPKYKYVLVPIKSSKRKKTSSRKKV